MATLRRESRFCA